MLLRAHKQTCVDQRCDRFHFLCRYLCFSPTCLSSHIKDIFPSVFNYQLRLSVYSRRCASFTFIVASLSLSACRFASDIPAFLWSLHSQNSLFLSHNPRLMMSAGHKTRPDARAERASERAKAARKRRWRRERVCVGPYARICVCGFVIMRASIGAR